MAGSTTSSETAPQLQRRNYYLLGYNIQKSFSPLLHNTGFKTLGLPHHYALFEVPSVDSSVETLLQDPALGGLSVTAPHKLQVGRFLDHISDDARTMGSVNTIAVKESASGTRTLYGENTDWQGISRCITRSNICITSTTVGAVIGAGGAARAAVFAQIKLGVKRIFIVNRTRSRAEELVATFPAHDIQIVASLSELAGTPNSTLSIIVGCIPATVLTESDVSASLFSRVKSGVLVEMAYGSETALVAVAKRQVGWKLFDGLDVLQQQAFGQFTLWTGQPAPEMVMMEAVNGALGRATNPAFLEASKA